MQQLVQRDVIIQYLSKSLLIWCTTTSIVLSFYYSTVCILSSTMNSRIQWQASEQKIFFSSRESDIHDIKMEK